MNRRSVKMDKILLQHAYRTHEFGDSVFVEKSRDCATGVRSSLYLGCEVVTTTEGHTLQRFF